ncbi:MAG: ATPase [Firmicutes bacterium HGW-Firmicutes-4]|jgi:MoxR-like ATPase|uniref:AAA domain-containing protein n=1 Tax=Acetobacterium malicum TaxID=52692 RepID=A0ABR6YX49_9FIRM|nr:MoxR family ATPase [Acetobacterium malicum]MBC3899768.1 AAA domain-containing protein [Acetobacterium malicum]PKM55104.1 MAG: ATPase [Firmicutes bacterium HGW-Firmicutes-3]PKM59473.1 MAG: ATPase [Firmicutes bacterium HGW-Firmicutes-4]
MNEFDNNMNENLLRQGIRKSLLDDVSYFKKEHILSEELKDRIPLTNEIFIGKDIWEMCITAILEGENILLIGQKATGKNVLADNICQLFGRPQWSTSFHVNTDSASLIGTDTFIENEVKLRRGSVYECGKNGGFGIFDEINMAKNDAMVVLHSALDYRKVIDVPGYDKIHLHIATRFIGTMNYDYAGTKDLNEALVSRFMTIQIPQIGKETLQKILNMNFPDANTDLLTQFVGVFLDLQEKAMNSEISTKSVDLRGIIASLKTIRRGLKPLNAISMGIIGKTFDQYEKEIVMDVVRTRICDVWESNDVFPQN